jgi:phage-related protein
MGTALADLRSFATEVRAIAGFQLWRVQLGLLPNDWKRMPSIGPGVQEIRIRTGQEHRVIYTARFSEGVYVLHVFQKRSRKTLPKDIRLSRRRLELLLSRRREVDP